MYRGEPDPDADAHAIIYARGTQPYQGPNERRMIKDPIEVAMDNHGEPLPPLSRLNFGKVHTVEHNVKVLPVGQVTSDSLEKFNEYARDRFHNILPTLRQI